MKFILQVNDTDTFDEGVWQTKTYFTENNYNEWLTNAADNLQRARNIIEDAADGDMECLEELKNALNTIDVNLIGDVVNLMEQIHICSDYSEVAVSVSGDDFSKYDTSELTEEKMQEMILLAAENIQNDDNINDSIRCNIDFAAEVFELTEID